MRIFLTTLTLLVAYQILIAVNVVPPGVGRDNFETNCITSESWRYKKSLPDAVLVGSSKTNFIDYEAVGPTFAHLGYGGQGSLTGLEILHRSQQIPKLVLVEVSDTLQWSIDEQCVALATNDRAIGDFIYPMQHRYEPCAVLLKAMGPQQIPEPNTRSKLIQIQREQLSIPLREPKRVEVLKNIERAKALIAALRSRGATVVLFDVPVEKVIHDSQFVHETSAFIDTEFSSLDCEKLRYPGDDLHTRDGTHLLPESGAKFSRWLKSALDKSLH